MFDTQGYQGHDDPRIARHAHVSVAAVFTTFASKGEILSQVMQDRLTGSTPKLDRVMPHLRGGTVDRLRTMFAHPFRVSRCSKRGCSAHIAAAYDWTLPEDAKPMARTPACRRSSSTPQQGVGEGDVDGAIEPQEIVDLRVAAYAGPTASRRERRGRRGDDAGMDRQIGLIASGSRRAEKIECQPGTRASRCPGPIDQVFPPNRDIEACLHRGNLSLWVPVFATRKPG